MKLPRLLPSVLGFLSGVCATGPMSALMLTLHRQLPEPEKYPLPPREITESLARKANVRRDLTGEELSALTWLAHFGYGGAAGAVYANCAVPLSPWVRGPIFGFILWLASYLGLLPALGILRSAEKHPARRNALMIAAHLLWGLTTATLLALLQENKQLKSAA